ncbi:MAG TPA: YaiI/YqxD family protein [Treponema sp.]|nr:YaiI/YqxD family protein [Treponema sp.]
MRIFVDADSCPRDARSLVIRRAAKLGIQVVFAANRPIPGANSSAVVMEICPAVDGAADDRIVEMAQPGDLVISRDVPLARRLVENGITVLNDRGRVFSRENIGELLSLRNFTVGLALDGLGIERTEVYGKKELKTFADSFDRILTRMINSRTQGTSSASV